jgi:hypothetical protein
VKVVNKPPPPPPLLPLPLVLLLPPPRLLLPPPLPPLSQVCCRARNCSAQLLPNLVGGNGSPERVAFKQTNKKSAKRRGSISTWRSMRCA